MDRSTSGAVGDPVSLGIEFPNRDGTQYGDHRVLHVLHAIISEMVKDWDFDGWKVYVEEARMPLDHTKPIGVLILAHSIPPTQYSAFQTIREDWFRNLVREVGGERTFKILKVMMQNNIAEAKEKNASSPETTTDLPRT